MAASLFLQIVEIALVFVRLDHDTSSSRNKIEALTAGLQKVGAYVEQNKLSPQTVRNDHSASASSEELEIIMTISMNIARTDFVNVHR